MIVIIQVILLIMGVVNLLFPISVGLAENNLYFTFIKGVCTNFSFVFCIMLAILLVIHLVEMRKKKEYLDKKTDILLTLFFGITILLAYI